MLNTVCTRLFISQTQTSKAARASRSDCPNEGLLTPEPQRFTSCSSRNDATTQKERGPAGKVAAGKRPKKKPWIHEEVKKKIASGIQVL